MKKTRCALGLSALMAQGCYSFSTLGRAHTIGAHHVEVFAAPAALIVPAPAVGQIAVRPVAEIGMRYGVTDGVDLEGRVTALGGTLAAHVQLRRDPERYGIEVMLAPGIAYTVPDKLAFEVPLVLGLNVGRDNQIVVAPRIAYQLRFGVPGIDRPISFIFLGASIGFAWRLAKHVTLMPEMAFLGQAFAEAGFSSNLQGTVGMQGSLGLLLDF